MFILIALVFFVAAIFIKKKKIKWTFIVLNMAWGLYLMITAKNYSGGGGYGDLAVFLEGIIIFLVSFIQATVVKILAIINKNKNYTE